MLKIMVRLKGVNLSWQQSLFVGKHSKEIVLILCQLTIDHWKTSFEKNCFSAWASMLIMGLINKGWYGMFVACGIWCLADILSISPSSEQTVLYVSLLRWRANAWNIGWTPYPTGDKHTISTLLIKPIFSVLTHAEKQFFSKLVF